MKRSVYALWVVKKDCHIPLASAVARFAFSLANASDQAFSSPTVILVRCSSKSAGEVAPDPTSPPEDAVSSLILAPTPT
jgi:hypothetical protein